VTLTADAQEDIYTVDYPIPDAVRMKANGKFTLRFVAKSRSTAGGLYGLWLLR
jgi:hypothetical protein